MFRRDFKLFSKCLISALLMLTVLLSVSIAAAASMIRVSGSTFTPAKVSVVDNDSSALGQMIIGAISNMDAIAGLIEVVTMEESDAMDAIASGECAAVILLPEGFVDDFMNGIDTKGKIILSPMAGSHADIIEATAKFGERLLVAGQSGVLTGYRLITEHALGKEARDSYLKRANLLLVSGALAASEQYFTVDTLDYSGTGVSVTAHYVMCFSVMLLFMLSLFFVPLITQDASRPMLSRLRALGIGNAGFMAPKLTYLFVLRALLMVFAVLFFGNAIGMRYSATSFASLLTTCAYVTLVGTALTLCVGDPITGNAISALGGMLLCGGIVPRQLLPDAVTAIGDLTPYGAANALMSPMFGGTLNISGAFAAVFYTAIAVIMIRLWLNRVISGRV